MKKKFLLVDAFTRERFAGNRAGFVADADALSPETMLAVAAEVNASETAFLHKAGDADFRLRFFTPEVEVPFCGHAFVGAVHAMISMGAIKPEGDFARIAVRTGAGLNPVDIVREDGWWRIDMYQAKPAFRPDPHPADAVASALGTGVETVTGGVETGLAYTGLWHLMVNVPSEEALYALKPDFAKLKGLNAEAGAHTTHVYSLTPDGPVCRSFAPAVGVDEDPVTGSAMGALGAYLVLKGMARPGDVVRMRQKPAGKKGGESRVVADGRPGNPQTVKVGGFAVVTISGEIEID